LRIKWFKALLQQDKKKREAEELAKKQKITELARKADEVEERYQ